MPTPRGAEVWRDYVTDGVPSSGRNEPSKTDARAWSTWLESLVTSGVLSSGPWFGTKEAMTLGYDADTIAVVYDDPTAIENGLYIKIGASGSGSWSQITTFLPGYQFVTASPTGASTANAIVATTSPRLPAGDGVALVTLPVPQTNTATPVTVSFDGGLTLTIASASGAAMKAGDLRAGMVLAGFVSGSTFRLLNDIGAHFITATNTGGVNAITATTPYPIPTGNGEGLIILPITATNTSSPVTVSFNGGSALTIKTRSGEDPATGELQAGDILSGFVSGSTFRLIVDPNSLIHMQGAKQWSSNPEDTPVPPAYGGDGMTTFSALHWAAKAGHEADRGEAARDAAEAYRDQAAGYVSDIASEKEVPIYATVSGMASITVEAGINVIRVNGKAAAGDGGAAIYRKVNDEPMHDLKFQSADGAWWELVSRWEDNVIRKDRGARPFVIAHRGMGSSSSPSVQNTLYAYSMLDHLAVRYWETDICLTSDGHFVLFHDDADLSGLMRDGTGAVADHTLADIQIMKFKVTEDTDLDDLYIPKFEEFLDLSLVYRPEGIHIELKGATSIAAYADAVEIIQAYDYSRRVTLYGPNIEGLRSIRKLDLYIGLAHVLTGDPTVSGTLATLSDLAALGNATALVPYANVISYPGWVSACHSRGVSLVALEMNHAYLSRSTYALGIDGHYADRLSYFIGAE